MSLPRFNERYRPSDYIKVNQRLSIPNQLLKNKNVILARNEDTVDYNSLIYLGKILEHTLSPDHFTYNVWLDVSYPYVILIPGRRGTGKSYTLGIITEGLALSKGENEVSTKDSSHTIVVVDTLGQFWQMKYAPSGLNEEEDKQMKLLQNWGLKPRGIENIQVFVPQGKKIRDDWLEFNIIFNEVELEEITGVLNLDVYQDRMGQLLNHVYLAVKEEGYSQAQFDSISGDITRTTKIAPKADYSIQDFIECIDSDTYIISPLTGFQIQTRRALRSRLVDMQRWKIFSQQGTKISEVYKKGMLTILNLEGVGEDFRNLMVGVLVRKIFQAREMTRRKEKISELGEEIELIEDDVPPGWLIIDEAHEYCPSAGLTASKNILIKYAKEGRSLGLGLIMATQQPSALSPKISSQAELIFSHALAFMADIRALNDRLVNRAVQEYQTRSESYSFEEQIRLLKPGAAIISALRVSRIFLMEFRPRVTIHGGKVPKME